MNDDPGTNSQFNPRIAVDQNTGYVAVSWHDCRQAVPIPSNAKTQFYGTLSRDGFATPKPRNFQLSWKQPSDSTPYIGGYYEYVGLACQNGFIYFLWPDNSNSTADNPDGTAWFDIYLRKVGF